MAAIINRAGISYFVNGSCSVLVNIGTSTANNWSINGSATDGTAFLGCMIRGSITGGGILQPDVIGSADYNLSGVGASYNGLDINTQSVNANLTGTGSINPPTGIIGHFNITHDGGATTVQGGFGSNL